MQTRVEDVLRTSWRRLEDFLGRPIANTSWRHLEKQEIFAGMALLDQSRESWPSVVTLGHVELTKMQKHLESKIKNKNEN